MCLILDTRVVVDPLLELRGAISEASTYTRVWYELPWINTLQVFIPGLDKCSISRSSSRGYRELWR